MLGSGLACGACGALIISKDRIQAICMNGHTFTFQRISSDELKKYENNRSENKMARRRSEHSIYEKEIKRFERGRSCVICGRELPLMSHGNRKSCEGICERQLYNLNKNRHKKEHGTRKVTAA